MSLPNDEWTEPPMPSTILPPRSIQTGGPLVSYDMGPVELSDSGEGTDAYAWEAWVEGDDVFARRRDREQQEFLFTSPGITQIDLTFNQNGQPFVIFNNGDSDIKIWWYDPQQSAQIITSIASGYQAHCFLDERRPQFSGTSDIILIYERGGTIYWRQQRERFDTERVTTIQDVPNIDIKAFGMGENQRLTIKAERPR